jgi:hypothetical protein
MTMRSIQIALMVAVSLLALGGMRLGTAQPATPNIIFILTDDLNADLIEFMPNLKQQLVAQGTTLKNFFVNVSLCCPSRANILRGQYAHNTQILTNLMPTGGFEKFYALGHESSTVATWLQAAGYRTCYSGKVPQRLSRKRLADPRSARLDRMVQSRCGQSLLQLQLRDERERQARPLRQPRRRLSH